MGDNCAQCLSRTVRVNPGDRVTEPHLQERVGILLRLRAARTGPVSSGLRDLHAHRRFCVLPSTGFTPDCRVWDGDSLAEATLSFVLGVTVQSWEGGCQR